MQPSLARRLILVGVLAAAAGSAQGQNGPTPAEQRALAEAGARSGTRYCISVYAGDAGGVRFHSDGVLGEAHIRLLAARIVQPPAPAGDPKAVPPGEPSPADPTRPAEPKPADVPSLDDLLGIKPGPGEPIAPAPDSAREELDRLLRAEEIGDAFKQAVTLMGDAAKRLEESKDTGLTTQRVQEDVIRRLDQLLASLERNQSSQSQSSQSEDDKQGQKNQPNQAKKSSKQTGQQTTQGDGTQEWEGPPKQEGALRPGLDSARAAWGSLPARVRDMLLQGSSDRFSSKYDELTRAYYKRLAEEKK